MQIWIVCRWNCTDAIAEVSRSFGWNKLSPRQPLPQDHVITLLWPIVDRPLMSLWLCNQWILGTFQWIRWIKWLWLTSRTSILVRRKRLITPLRYRMQGRVLSSRAIFLDIMSKEWNFRLQWKNNTCISYFHGRAIIKRNDHSRQTVVIPFVTLSDVVGETLIYHLVQERAYTSQRQSWAVLRAMSRSVSIAPIKPNTEQRRMVLKKVETPSAFGSGVEKTRVSTQLNTPMRPTNEPITTAIFFLTSLIQYARKSATGTARIKPKIAPMKIGSPGSIISDGKKLDAEHTSWENDKNSAVYSRWPKSRLVWTKCINREFLLSFSFHSRANSSIPTYTIIL